MLMLHQILGISWVALRWYTGSAKGVGRDVWTFKILKNFVVTSSSWESRVSHRSRMYLCWCAGCGVHAYLTPKKLESMLSNYYLVMFSPHVHPGLVEQEQ